MILKLISVILFFSTSSLAYSRRGAKGRKIGGHTFLPHATSEDIDANGIRGDDDLITRLINGVKSGKLTITESLDNGDSENQDDIEGQTTIGHLTHPTGNTVETLWNPIALGHGKPNPFPGNSTPFFPGPNQVVGLNKGWCISMVQNKYHCEEWFCNVHATFYKDVISLLSCFPPGPSCNAVQRRTEIGSIQFSGIWPSCAAPEEDFDFQLVINGGTGPFKSIKGGWVNVTQYIDYHFTYRFHFH